MKTIASYCLIYQSEIQPYYKVLIEKLHSVFQQKRHHVSNPISHVDESVN